MFSYFEPSGGVTLPQQRRCNVVHGLLLGIDCVSYRRQVPRLDESFVQRVPGRLG